jgi:two-component system, LytTR family, response regulator LytT
MKIRCLAVDDEPFALKQLAEYILKTSFLELTGTCSSAFGAMEVMQDHSVDLIYLDINMPELSGMDYARTLPAGTRVIFTTAHSEFAVESYKVEAVDYLLKPIPYEDFLRASVKALKLLGKDSGEAVAPVTDHAFVSSEGKIIRVNFRDIDFIESSSEYVKINLSDRTQITTLVRLKNLDALLPPDQFMRVHRSFIVNLGNITTLERNRIVFYGQTYIPVGEQYRALFRQFVESRFL